MLMAALTLAGLLQQPPATTPTPELSIISARLGPCSAEFTVTDADGRPVYAATVHVRIRYGFLGIKRMDLEVGTNSDGKARVEGLPSRARPLTYDISQGDKKATADQDLATDCQSTHAVALK